MKIIKKTKTIILLILIVFFSFPNIFIVSKQSFEFHEKDQVQINQSGIWNLTGSPIFIDDSDPNYNWSKIATENDWCSGSGNWTNPYIIENVSINGQGSDICIEIKNSDVYFIIRNCSLYNSGLTNAGIKLDNVTNGKIKNNNCSDNSEHGIYLTFSNNNTLSGNSANNNRFGIYTYSSDNNTISGNTITENFHGIFLDGDNNNILSGNRLNFCGISLGGSMIEKGSHSIDNTNLINNKPVYYYVNKVNLGSSNFTDAGQIILINCSDSIISGLNLSNGTMGIYLGYSNNNTLTGNTVSNNNYIGIYLGYSDYNMLEGNIVSNSDWGMELVHCDNNTLLGNTAINNGLGMSINNCDNNTLLGNNASYNDSGMNLYECDNNTLRGNTVNNNYHGIRLVHSNNNTLSGNTANNNNNVGISLVLCEDNVLLNNLMNYCGISLEGSLVEMGSHSIDKTNLVNNKPVYYYVNELSLGSSNFTDAGQIILINCSDSIISGLNLSTGPTGIYLGYSNNNTLMENIVNSNQEGIHLLRSHNNTLSGNNASNNGIGIYLMYSDYNTISGNIADSNQWGIFLSSSNNNSIVLNYFYYNHIDAEDGGINNRWDNGSIGNYWDDYSGVDADDDGIGDTPHIIPGSAGSQDNFPIWTDSDEDGEEDGEPIISFGNFYILFMFITIFAFIILEKHKKK